MTRAILVFTFFFAAATASAQAPAPRSVSYHAGQNAWIPNPPAGQLPHEQVSQEAMAFVFLFSSLPPLRVLEAVGLGIGTVVVVDKLVAKNEGDAYDGRGTRAALRNRFSTSQPKFPRRHSLIHRYY